MKKKEETRPQFQTPENAGRNLGGTVSVDWGPLPADFSCGEAVAVHGGPLPAVFS